MSIAASIAMNIEKNVLYIDTQAAFSGDRIKEILHSKDSSLTVQVCNAFFWLRDKILWTKRGQERMTRGDILNIGESKAPIRGYEICTKMWEPFFYYYWEGSHHLFHFIERGKTFWLELVIDPASPPILLQIINGPSSQTNNKITMLTNVLSSIS